MHFSISTTEKPTLHLSLADWYGRLWELQQTAQTRRNDSCRLRHDSRQLRNETNIKTNWDTYHNNVRLSDRIVEVDRWRDTLQNALDSVDGQIASLRNEKTATEHELDAVTISLGVVSECMSFRDARLGAEITYDDGDLELKKELCVLEDVKVMLTNRCQQAWENLNRLNEVRFKVSLDINNKQDALEIDNNQLTMDKNCANISFKTDPLRTPQSSVSHETWVEHSEHVKMLADNELANTIKLREALFVSREKARNDMKAQRDVTDFTLRKRIYETQKARNELQWQQHRMREEMEKLQTEMNSLQAALDNKTDALKLTETRLENRYLRIMVENARDEPEIGLRDEVQQLKQTMRDVTDNLNCVQTTYNMLEEQQIIIDRDLANKSHSLMTDIRCLDLRIKLRTQNFADPASETDRNIKLTKMEDEIPPT